MKIAQTVLYQVYVHQSSAQNDLRVTATPEEDVAAEGPLRICAAREFKARTLFLLPFNTTWAGPDQTQPKDSCPVIMTVFPEKEEKTTVKFWIKAKPTPKSLASSQDRAVVLVPFWALAAAGRKTTQSSSESSSASSAASDTHCLVYQQAVIDVPTPAAVLKGIRVAKAKIKLCVPCMTNKTIIAKGSRLTIAEKIPTDLNSLTPTSAEVEH